jgi:hypothetical protein
MREIGSPLQDKVSQHKNSSVQAKARPGRKGIILRGFFTFYD